MKRFRSKLHGWQGYLYNPCVLRMLLGSRCQGKLGMLQSMGSQRCGYDLATEQLQEQGGTGDHGYFLFHLFVLVVLGLCCCAGACLVAVSGASHCAGLFCCQAQAWAQGLQSFQHRGSGAVAHGPWSFSPSSTGALAL